MLCESDSMKFYIYFDADLRKYYPLRYKQEENYLTRLWDVFDIEFPEGRVLSKDKHGTNIVILPTGEKIPICDIDVTEDLKALYWEDRDRGKIFVFNAVN